MSKSATPTQKRLSREARREVIEQAATEVFARAGYHGASMDEIATRSGVSVPVLYDHFASKRDLHRRLLERHFAELRQVWGEHFPGDRPLAERLGRSFEAWFGYVESHPYAWRMLFADTSGDPEVAAVHREVAAASRNALLPLLAAERGSEKIAGGADPLSVEMAWETFRAVLQGLALWWYEHPDVPRERLVATAMNFLWVGFERVRDGEVWPGESPSPSREC